MNVDVRITFFFILIGVHCVIVAISFLYRHKHRGILLYMFHTIFIVFRFTMEIVNSIEIFDENKYIAFFLFFATYPFSIVMFFGLFMVTEFVFKEHQKTIMSVFGVFFFIYAFMIITSFLFYPNYLILVMIVLLLIKIILGICIDSLFVLFSYKQCRKREELSVFSCEMMIRSIIFLLGVIIFLTGAFLSSFLSLYISIILLSIGSGFKTLGIIFPEKVKKRS